MLIYTFALDFSIKEAEKLLPHLTHSTVVRFYNKLRLQIYDIIEHTMILEGSVDSCSNIVELDESLFGRKQKYNKGKATKKQWVFGLVERNTRKTYFIPVSDRSRATLLPIIQQRIKTDVTVYHDDFAVYKNLHEHSYNHGTVIHKEGFISACGVCTNSIEGM